VCEKKQLKKKHKKIEKNKKNKKTVKSSEIPSDKTCSRITLTLEKIERKKKKKY
jgi:hypothetical protein